MKRRGDEKDSFCSNRSKLDPIPFDLKMVTVTRLPAKTHQKKLLCGVESMVKRNDNEDDEKIRSQTKVDPIPLDLEVAILTRLPAKSLMKFRCVSKMWSSIIRSQRFVDSYYAMSSTMRSGRFIIAFSNDIFAKDDDKRLFIFSSSYETEESSSLVTNLDITIPSVTYASNCASVHGLIGCTKGHPLIVCNPSTKKITTLPCIRPLTSFGYDPVDDQYKALTMISFPHQKPKFLVHEVLTLGGGGESSSWRRNKVTTPLYTPVTADIYINGFVYYGAWIPVRSQNPVIVCFDVRFERISFIKAPMAVVGWESESILIEYKGKLASIARYPYAPFHSFDLWILEDVKKHDWSKQTFQLPFSLGLAKFITSPGTNKAGEIIFAPISLPRDVQPFYIFYFNVERKDIRRVRLHGIADSEEFRRRYGLIDDCCVSILPKHVESIASL